MHTLLESFYAHLGKYVLSFLPFFFFFNTNGMIHTQLCTLLFCFVSLFAEQPTGDLVSSALKELTSFFLPAAPCSTT